MIIFHHIPKTGGVSFRVDIENGLAGRHLLDENDYPVSNSEVIRLYREAKYKLALCQRHEIVKSYDIIYGHFVADKYEFLKSLTNVSYITFFREPSYRTISHYYFWKTVSAHSPEISHLAFPELKLIERGELNLIDFARLEKMRSFYKIFLGKFKLSDYSFIGITERYAESISLINKMFNLSFSVRVENATDKTIYADEIKRDYNEVKKANAENYHYYNEALKLFDKQTNAI